MREDDLEPYINKNKRYMTDAERIRHLEHGIREKEKKEKKKPKAKNVRLIKKIFMEWKKGLDELKKKK